ncbi:MAG: hypothetical protein CM15mP98_09120 [Paracoccaceae bacterium]|nr:MAG: hypothetical protein CM15mP98_09120 [Paracoccaceae bacterium]
MNVISTKSKEHKVNTITEMCKLFQVSARTLRFYESKSYLFPIERVNIVYSLRVIGKNEINYARKAIWL